MDDAAFSIKIGLNKYIVLSPLSKEAIEASGVDGLGDDFGYFVFESVGGVSPQKCSKVLAKCPDYESASRLMEIYSMALHHRVAA